MSEIFEEEQLQWILTAPNGAWRHHPQEIPIHEISELAIARYKGQLVDSFPHGLGKMYSQDNKDKLALYYEGEWVSGKYHGRGRLLTIEMDELTAKQRAVLPSNVLQYRGDEKFFFERIAYEQTSAEDKREDVFKVGCRPPVLSLYGNAYVGQFLNGVEHGYGRKSFLGGDYYEGEFRNGKITGMGILITDKGNTIYKGQFFNGRYHGKGKLTSRTKESIEGEWVLGEPQGIVKVVTPGGDRYEGEMKHGMFHGKGKLKVRQDGSTYEGEFKYGTWDGHGKITMMGMTVEGMFERGRPKGLSKVTKDGVSEMVDLNAEGLPTD
jgi:hypothetical protein